MFIKKALIAALSLSALLASTANAESYITVGSGYDLNKLRVKVAPSQNGTISTNSLNQSFNPGNNISFMIGVGGCLNPEIRSDLTLHYQPRRGMSFQTPDLVQGNSWTDTFSFDSEKLTAMANLYWDISSVHERFIPYIMAGLGATYNKATNMQAGISNFSGTGTTPVPLIQDANGKTIDKMENINLAYQAGLGMSTIVTDNVTLDVGYRFMGLGSTAKVKYLAGKLNNDGTTSTTPIGNIDMLKFKHNFSAGIRFNF